MANQESFVFAGTEWNDGTTFDMEVFDPGVAAKRFRWVSGADSDGAILADESHYDNAETNVRVRIVQQADMDTALAKIGDLVKALQECEKQPLGSAGVWTPATSTKSLTGYFLSGEVVGLPIEWESGYFVKTPVVTMKLYRRPFWYGAEVTSAATVTNTDPYQILTVASVPGDVPAEARLVVTDAATQSRRHVEWGLEQRYYNAATSLIVESDNLVTSGFAGTGTTRAGAYDPGAAGNSVVRGTLVTTPTAICGTGNLSHVGTFRVKARVFPAMTSGAQYVRLVWQEGDGPFRANEWTKIPTQLSSVNWQEIDLGPISVPEKVLGTQRWSGRIEAYADFATADTLDIDYLFLIPTEGYGKARASIPTELPTVPAARDEFDQTAGNLNAKTLPVGGTWATSGADATDLAVEATNHTAQRSTTSDGSGKTAIAGTTAFTNVVQQIDFKASAYPSGVTQYMFARYVDANNYLQLHVSSPGSTQSYLDVNKVVAGSATRIGRVVVPFPVSASTWYTMRILVDASGLWAATVFPKGSQASWLSYGSDSVLATGGTLASGKAGFWDLNSGATASTRNYDNFYAAVPSSVAVVFSLRAAEIRHNEAIRQDSTGTYYGPVDTYRGDRFLLPPAGSAARTSRVFVKARRNDVDVMLDDNIADSTTATIHYTPRYLVAPR